MCSTIELSPQLLCIFIFSYKFLLLIIFPGWPVHIFYFMLQELLIASRNLEFFTNGYRYLIQILPAAVVAPMYFSGKIEFGVINQSVSAFNHILSDFSLIVFQFQSISAFSAVIDRLGDFSLLPSLASALPASLPPSVNYKFFLI